MTIRKLGRCQVEGCHGDAKYAMFRLYPGGIKEWLHVCPQHEQMIGDNNMYLQGYNPKTGKRMGGKQ